MVPTSAEKWVKRWGYEMTAKSLRPGIWKMRTGGFFVRTRIVERTGRTRELQRVLHRATLRQAEDERDAIAADARELESGRKQAPMQWSKFARSLFEEKVNEKRIKSAKNREHWGTVLQHLILAFGDLYVDEIQPKDIAGWREGIAKAISEGMQSTRKRDAGKIKIVSLSPVTANGWIGLLRLISAAMTKRFALEHDPCADLQKFPVPRTYTREQPNSLKPEQVPIFLSKLKELFPQHYAMIYLGFAIGARPSSLRPLRRCGDCADVLWHEGLLLLRRSHTLGDEIMDQTKTGEDQEVALPTEMMRVLREHVATLKGPMAKSEYLFPAITGGIRSQTALAKPFAAVISVLGWKLRLTPRSMRRTFQDLARRAAIHDVVTRSISGHETEEMQRHYSTAQLNEQRDALTRVMSLMTH